METLNEKIYDILGRFSMGEVDSTAPTQQQAAKEIEKLIIQENISYLKEAKDLLDRAYKFNNSDMGWDVDYETWKENYEKLTTKLNKLNY